MGAIKFTDLRVWQKAYKLAIVIDRLTKTFPPTERYRLADQMCRAASSVPLNSAEGFPRRTRKDQAHYYTIAKTSIEELKVCLMMVRDLVYAKDVADLEKEADDVGAMLYGLRERVLGR